MKAGHDDSDARALADWLVRIERLHPREIELGLERVSDVARRMDLLRPQAHVITVAGTNGKGSCVAALEQFLLSAGYRAGSFTSPHLLHYNERIRVDGRMVSDRALCDSFARIEAARGTVPLTYFEYGTLAALDVFRLADLDVILLEVGLGGRLDAVNMLDADHCLISSIDLDHQDWLGETREEIALEKAGILRPGTALVCGDPQPPHSLLARARELACPLYCIGREFDALPGASTWQWKGLDDGGRPLTLDDLPLPALALANVASALQLLLLTDFAPDRNAIVRALESMALPGRQQLLQSNVPGGPHNLLDVAHNPHAGALLAKKLQTLRTQGGAVHLVLAMMADKDHAGFLSALEKQVDFWYVAQVQTPRCLPAAGLMRRLEQQGGAAAVSGPHPSVEEAWQLACTRAKEGDTIVTTGSFHTVSVVLQLLADTDDSHSAR